MAEPNQQVGRRAARGAPGPLLRLKHTKGADPVPGGGAFPHVTDAALEGFRAVPEGADATIPKAFVRRGLRLSFRPAEERGAGRGAGRGREGETAVTGAGEPR